MTYFPSNLVGLCRKLYFLFIFEVNILMGTKRGLVKEEEALAVTWIRTYSAKRTISIGKALDFHAN